MIPTAASRGGNNKVMYGLIAGVGVLAIVAVVLVVVMMARTTSPRPPPTSPTRTRSG
jgi:hypothetical protein